jgi:hypothetical protein
MGACVKGATLPEGVSEGRAACFPGDAVVTRVAGVPGVTGDALGRVRMDDLAVGDAIECLMPRGLAATKEYRDDQQTYVPSVCHVYGYLDVNAVSPPAPRPAPAMGGRRCKRLQGARWHCLTPHAPHPPARPHARFASLLPAPQGREAAFVSLHYTDASGAPAALRATREHLVYVAAGELPQTAPVAALPPGGRAARADAVAVGDLLVVAAPADAGGERAFYTARVTKITRCVGKPVPCMLAAREGCLAFSLGVSLALAASPAVPFLPYTPPPCSQGARRGRRVRAAADQCGAAHCGRGRGLPLGQHHLPGRRAPPHEQHRRALQVAWEGLRGGGGGSSARICMPRWRAAHLCTG